MTPLFDGSGVALVTPFDEAGVNERVLAELVEFHLREGTDALVVCGSTGEAVAMSAAEQRRATAVVVEAAAGRVPVIAGVGGSGTAMVAYLARQAREVGADALLLAPPPYNRPSQAGIAAHCREVMRAGDLPTILYNVPSRTACNLLPATIAELAEGEPRVVGVKEASGDLSQVADLARLVEGRMALWSGNDDQVLPLLSLGGRGVISVLANVAPAGTSKMVHDFLGGEVEAATRAQLDFLPLVRALFAEPNPVPAKAGVRMLGFDAGEVRLPLVPLTPEGERELRRAMDAAGLLRGAAV